MKKLLWVIRLLILLAFASGCTPGPKRLTGQFLNELRNGQYTSADTMAAPEVIKEISIIEQDKYALYNGQKWNFGELTAQFKDDIATVLYSVMLKDGTKIRQRAKLAKSNNRWLIHAIENIKINYSAKALKERTYQDYGNQMLIAPLDIEYITKSKLPKHLGQFVMISGNLCDFEERNNTLTMSMGEDSSMPLLYVTIVGSAKTRAIKDHKKYLQIDYRVESPLGDTFTAIGLLRQAKGRFSMEVSNPQNIVTGPVLRVEKR
ncbi:hypothetical protein ABDD95_06540 [Mucilaginibacter sp. PAMB04274]|uniref:hypothetical protein n=1 Tax=Mucilaginibacter sp. PAMB04274 TaxID=3138568 RepID=UPI0031F71865